MRRRSAFTLIELLVVISILLILSTLVWAVFKPSNTDKTRSAARVAQSAFLGAKDRALHAKDLRGVRLIRDTTDPTLVTGFVYLRALDPLIYPTGSIQLERIDRVDAGGNPPPDDLADSADVFIVRGFDANSSAPPPQNAPPAGVPFVDWNVKQQFFASPGRIRIPSQTGQWYTFYVDTVAPYILGSGNEVLHLQTPFVGTPTFAFNNVIAYPTTNLTSNSCDIQLANDALPFHQPIPLSSGVVIDLNYSSTNVKTLAGIGTGTYPYIDIMFSPRGGVTGYLSGLGPLHFLMRDLRSVTAQVDPTNIAASNTSGSDMLVLTVFPQTGLVQVFEVDPTDVLTNGTTAGPPDGLVDDLFAFAKQGKAAGR